MALIVMNTPSTGLNVVFDAISCVVIVTALGADWLMAAAAGDVSKSLTLVTLERGSVKSFPW